MTGLLAVLAPRAVGAQVTVFDPDLDPDGSHARLLTDILVTGLAQLGGYSTVGQVGQGFEPQTGVDQR